MILWVRTGSLMRPLGPGALLSLPGVGGPVVGGGLSMCTSSLWSQLVTGCLAMRFFIHLLTPPVSLFGIWNKKNCLMNTGEWS